MRDLLAFYGKARSFNYEAGTAEAIRLCIIK